MILIKANPTQMYRVSVLMFGRCRIFGTTCKTTEVKRKMRKQAYLSCSTLHWIELLFTLFVSDGERKVFVNEAINWRAQSIQPPNVSKNKVPLAFNLESHLWDGGWSGGLRRWEVCQRRTKSHSKWITPRWSRLRWGRWRLHLVGGDVMLWDSVGMSHRRVILIEAPHTIHFIVDAAGDVLNVLHMGPDEQIS